MKETLRKSTPLLCLGAMAAMLSACVDTAEQDRERQSSMAGMSCPALATKAAVTREKIKGYTEKGTVSAIASALSTGTTSQVNDINASLSQIARRDIEAELKAVEILMAKKDCN